MRAPTPAMLLGGVAPLIAAAAASAEFVGVTVESKPNEFGIVVCNVYAEFDAPDDQAFAVAGIGGSVLDICVVDGTFYQHPFGNDRAPNPALFEVAPALRYDTFVTIGVKSFNPNDPGNPEGQPEDQLQFSVGWPGFGPGALHLTDGFWAVVAGAPQGQAFHPDFVAGDGRVLIGQFATLDGIGVEGTMELFYFIEGVAFSEIVGFEHIAAPACLSVESEEIICHADGETFTYTVQGTESCTGSSSTYTFTGSGGAVGEELCFSVMITDDQGGLCCTSQVCVTVPDCSEAAPGDLDADGIVGILDLLALFGAWGACIDCASCPADVDVDCTVGVVDMLILLEHWG